ncbi:hypothetical protein [Pediococcus acidilactici]|uniref:hypothetical protein n=1 Tax=Pediococcus acidilactici TaxID=1254 RepID=UPI001324BD0D|nr:hypothetical protein [Pediococcus acidilactici]KAF0336866.1 hypothetical protein GBO39_08245 [Pediococcus acidilactici]KAF0348471.1 hypothetical protein GBO45_07465 [Pediococcus acidilactici]KAF0386101.1 hypothetical protein GBO65_08070 [Pediococcus acidilactici]KAF0427320.1 hypothetical protein GBO85_07130 [Pediococcus acidilactici]KAF0443174.1 hypothetical protein GBO95_07075 [Pediococcus acidilactici]
MTVEEIVREIYGNNYTIDDLKRIEKLVTNKVDDLDHIEKAATEEHEYWRKKEIEKDVRD